jgi:hypothetical protein
MTTACRGTNAATSSYQRGVAGAVLPKDMHIAAQRTIIASIVLCLVCYPHMDKTVHPGRQTGRNDRR